VTVGFVHPFSPAGRADPYAGYRWLRANEPVHYDPGSRFWLLTRHADCALALRDPRFSAALGQRQRARGEPLPASMLTTDPPEHDRLRAPGALLLSPGALRPVLSTVESEVDAVLSGLAGASTVDVTAEVGEPLATAVLGTLLAVPRRDWSLFAGLARGAAANLDPAAPVAAGQHAMGLLNRYLGAHLDTVPPDSPVGRLAADTRLTRPEALGILALIVVGGWQPLAELAGNALALALPYRLDSMAAAALATDEVLRMEAPIPFVARVTTAPVDLAHGTLPAGARVLAVLAAANRDPEVFDAPEEFVPDRAPNPHLGLGGGAHYCLGAVLVRQAGARLLYELRRRYPGLTEKEPPTWAPTILPRRLARYRVAPGVPA
jgi:cytochrome P450